MDWHEMPWMESEDRTEAGEDGAALAERVRLGDHAAEKDLYVRFSGRVFAMGVARLKDREAARELAVDVVWAVIQALRRGSVLDTQRLGAFVHGTAVNMINNHARSRARRPQMDPIDESLVTIDHADSLERDSDLQLIGRCLGGLTAPERQVLVLSLAEGLKPGEMAARLGVSSEVIRQQKSRALKRLRDELGRVSRNASRRPLWRG